MYSTHSLRHLGKRKSVIIDVGNLFNSNLGRYNYALYVFFFHLILSKLHDVFSRIHQYCHRVDGSS